MTDELAADPKWVPVAPDPGAVRESARKRAELLAEVDQAFADWYMAYTTNSSRRWTIGFRPVTGEGGRSLDGLRADWRAEQVDRAIASMSSLEWIQGHIIGLLVCHIEQKDYMWHPSTISGRSDKSLAVLVDLAAKVKRRIESRVGYPMPITAVEIS